MSRTILIIWTLFAAAITFCIGVGVAFVPSGSIWAGLYLMMLGGGLGYGIGHYLYTEHNRHRTAVVSVSPEQLVLPQVPIPTVANVASAKPAAARIASPERSQSQRSAVNPPAQTRSVDVQSDRHDPRKIAPSAGGGRGPGKEVATSRLSTPHRLAS